MTPDGCRAGAQLWEALVAGQAVRVPARVRTSQATTAPGVAQVLLKESLQIILVPLTVWVSQVETCADSH